MSEANVKANVMIWFIMTKKGILKEKKKKKKKREFL